MSIFDIKMLAWRIKTQHLLLLDGFCARLSKQLRLLGRASKNAPKKMKLIQAWGMKMRLKIKTIGDGQHPSESVVVLKTADGGSEELIVDKRSISSETLRIGYPIIRDGNRLLVELPRETLRGSWRVWVTKESVEGAA